MSSVRKTSKAAAKATAKVPKARPKAAPKRRAGTKTARPAPRKRANGKGVSRERLLDAGEQLFSEIGYHGSSVRNIASAAGLPFGLANYYFGTKQELFRQVVARRAAEHTAAILGSMKDLLERCGDRRPTAEELILAYLQPVVDKVMRGGLGWRIYMKLIGRSLNMDQSQPFLRPLVDLYDPVRKEFVRIARFIFPDASEDSMQWACYLLHSCLIHVVSDGGSIDRLSGGRQKSADLDTLLTYMAPLFGAGFDRVAQASR
jgi:AcrR family transcriptional regulator